MSAPQASPTGRPPRRNGPAALSVGILALILGVFGLLGGMVSPDYTWPVGALAVFFGLVAALMGSGARPEESSARAGATLGWLSVVLVIGGLLLWWQVIAKMAT